MSEYQTDSKRVATDAQAHIDSEYGKYRMGILDELIEGALSAASNPTQQFPDRYMARYGALKEIKDSIQSDLESYTLTRTK